MLLCDQGYELPSMYNLLTQSYYNTDTVQRRKKFMPAPQQPTRSFTGALRWSLRELRPLLASE